MVLASAYPYLKQISNLLQVKITDRISPEEVIFVQSLNMNETDIEAANSLLVTHDHDRIYEPDCKLL